MLQGSMLQLPCQQHKQPTQSPSAWNADAARQHVAAAVPAAAQTTCSVPVSCYHVLPTPSDGMLIGASAGATPGDGTTTGSASAEPERHAV